MSRAIILLLAVPAIITAGCSSDSEPPGTEFVLESVIAPPANSLPGQVFDGLSIRVVNNRQEPLPGIPVTFGGEGTVEPASDVTGADGTIRLRWSLPATSTAFGQVGGPPGEYALTATAGAQTITMATSAHAFRLDMVDASSDAACGLVDHSLWCWGAGLSAFMRSPGGTPSSVPAQYSSVSGPLDVTVTNNAVCVLEITGHPFCSTSENGRQFNPVSNSEAITDLSDGEGYVCGRSRNASRPVCWYTTGPAAMQSSGVFSDVAFIQVGAGGGYDIVNGGGGFGCGLTLAGEVWCWGENGHGQLGNGTNDDAPSATIVSGDHVFTQLEVSNSGACAVAGGPEIWCWGYRGPLMTESSVPVRVSYPGGSGPLLGVGDFEAYVNTPAGRRMWSSGTVDDVGLDALGLVSVSSDGQLCGLTAASETYCSRILIYGGGDTFITPGVLAPLPPPEVALPD